MQKENELWGILKHTRTHLMNGVSYMIPVVVGGGILCALAMMINGGAAAVPDSLRSLKSIIIIPIIGLFVTGGLMVCVLGGPLASVNSALTSWLTTIDKESSKSGAQKSGA